MVTGSSTPSFGVKELLSISSFQIGSPPGNYYITAVTPDKELMVATEDDVGTAAIYLLDRQGNVYAKKTSYNLGTRPLAKINIDNYILVGYGSYKAGSTSAEKPCLWIFDVVNKTVKRLFYENGGVTTHNFGSFIYDKNADLLIVGTNNGGQHVLGFRFSELMQVEDEGDISSHLVFDIDFTDEVGSPSGKICNIVKFNGEYYVVGGRGWWENANDNVGLWKINLNLEEISGSVDATGNVTKIWGMNGSTENMSHLVHNNKLYINAYDGTSWKVYVYDGNNVSEFTSGLMMGEFMGYLIVIDNVRAPDVTKVTLVDDDGNVVYTYNKQYNRIVIRGSCFGIFTDYDTDNGVAHIMQLTINGAEPAISGVVYDKDSGVVKFRLVDKETGEPLVGASCAVRAGNVQNGAYQVDTDATSVQTGGDGWVVASVTPNLPAKLHVGR